MLKPLSWLLIAGLTLAGCGRPAVEAPADRRLKVEAYDPVSAAAPLGAPLQTMDPHPEGETQAPPLGWAWVQVAPAAVRLAIQRIADPAPAAQPSPQKPVPADPAAAQSSNAQAGFRITVPLCRDAERANDPLARTAECAQLLQAARDQARACRQAFENGDDKVVLSPACRQAAGFR